MLYTTGSSLKVILVSQISCLMRGQMVAASLKSLFGEGSACIRRLPWLSSNTRNGEVIRVEKEQRQKGCGESSELREVKKIMTVTDSIYCQLIKDVSFTDLVCNV